jgi:hypothetical protein
MMIHGFANLRKLLQEAQLLRKDKEEKKYCDCCCAKERRQRRSRNKTIADAKKKAT